MKGLNSKNQTFATESSQTRAKNINRKNRLNRNKQEINGEEDYNGRSPNAYSQTAANVAESLGVDFATGLTEIEATRRLLRNGENTLVATRERSAIRILLSQFSSIVVWLLAIAAVVAWFTENSLEALAILAVLFLNAIIGFAIEMQAGRALAALRKVSRSVARVRRDQYEKLIDAAELVIGDVIILSAGDRVPADARLFESAGLSVDESMLTGESKAVDKSPSPVLPEALLAERFSMLYLGTNILSGRAAAIVTATGEDTELGHIGQLIAETGDGQTPLEQKLATLGKQLVYIVLGIAAVVMLTGFLRGDEWWLMLEVSISLAVAAVPEGLPAVTTLILALGVLRMARHRAIVRKLAAVETLGSTTVICTDKTGTLTENRMTVQEYRLANGEIIQLHSKTKNENADKNTNQWQNTNFLRLLMVSMLCNEASFNPENIEGKQTIGDPTETALLIAVDKLGFDILKDKSSFKKQLEIPFDAATKRMITVLQDKDKRVFSVMKGAPGVILERCTRYIAEDGSIALLDDENRRRFLQINEEMADRTLRVLAFADKGVCEALDKNSADFAFSKNDFEGKNLESDYTFLGFAGMTDPPRRGAADAIRKAQEAGIRIVMLTGDQINTARAIAKELRLSRGEDVYALHSNDLMVSDEETIVRMARMAHVFARVSPEDKLRIVEALQKAGEIVAVTGDGVNDAPALKQADIGVAMGMNGTDVAKETADIILTNDNFSTIVKAVEGGRTIYANIVRFVHLMFSHNLGEVLVIFSAIVLGLPLPLLPLQILWMNLVTDIFPALALAVEPATKETMHRPPRHPRESFLSYKFMLLITWQGVMLAAIVLAAYYWALQNYGEGVHARTLALLALISVQLGHLFNCRSRTRSVFDGFWKNPFIFIAVAIVLVLQVIALNFAPLTRVLNLVSPTRADWLIILLCFVLPVVFVEIAKALFHLSAAPIVKTELRR